MSSSRTTTGTHAASLDALAKVLDALDSLQPQDQAWVVTTAQGRLGLKVAATDTLAGGGVDDSGQRGASPNQPKIGEASPREFMRAKRPESDVQRVACLAYYLARHRSTLQFKTRDLTTLNVDAAGHAIGNPSMAVSNATRQNHYFAPCGGGKKQLTPLGESIVEALPDQEAVKKVEVEQKPKKRARRGRSKVSGS